MHLSDLFDDTSFDMELDKIKEKIVQLYNQVLEKAYKMENPTGTPEEMAMFLEENGLEFKSEKESFDAESTELQGLLDEMLGGSTDDLDPVKDKNYTNPTIEKGPELKAHRSKLDLPQMSDLPVPKGLMATPEDVHKKIPKGVYVEPKAEKIAKRKPVPVDVSYTPVVQEISSKLASLEQRRDIGRMKQFDRLEA